MNKSRVPQVSVDATGERPPSRINGKQNPEYQRWRYRQKQAAAAGDLNKTNALLETLIAEVQTLSQLLRDLSQTIAQQSMLSQHLEGVARQFEPKTATIAQHVVNVVNNTHQERPDVVTTFEPENQSVEPNVVNVVNNTQPTKSPPSSPPLISPLPPNNPLPPYNPPNITPQKEIPPLGDKSPPPYAKTGGVDGVWERLPADWQTPEMRAMLDAFEMHRKSLRKSAWTPIGCQQKVTEWLKHDLQTVIDSGWHSIEQNWQGIIVRHDRNQRKMPIIPEGW
jgi:hypothetical protein